jgi:hypothetical protein
VQSYEIQTKTTKNLVYYTKFMLKYKNRGNVTGKMADGKGMGNGLND